MVQSYGNDLLYEAGAQLMNQETDPLPDIETMHREHRDWLGEYATWMNEVAAWQREQQLAEAMLYQLERALPDHFRKLTEHSTSIASHEKHLCEHEKRLYDYEIDGQQCKERIADLVEAHRLQEEYHAREYKQHDAFRYLHHSAMAEFKRIAKLMHKIDK
ncbi:MAG: hypothetical protein ABF297_06550 [Thiogranum sp.]